MEFLVGSSCSRKKRADQGAAPSRNGSVVALESVGRVGASFLWYFVCFSLCFGSLVEMEDTEQVPRVGVLNYVASAL